MIDAFQPTVVYTDSTGRVHVSELLPGFFRVAAHKAIAAGEAARVGGVARAFGDGMRTWLPAASIELTLRADQGGSLVISEFYYGGRTWEVDYQWAQFWELYNNSDTTVHLDGMLLGGGFGHFGSTAHTCDELAPLRESPFGIFSLEFHQFPGTGRDYPVAPGEAVVVALDAVDHSQVHPTLLDLSGADFELEGGADPDNPDVPNMPTVGPHAHPYGHGMMHLDNMIKFLALPTDPATLTTVFHVRYDFALVPAELIVDVHQANWMHPESSPYQEFIHYCSRWINREYDRLAAPSDKMGDADNMTSLQRRVLRYTPDGRAILQDLNVSYFDFVIAKYSPGRVEY